MVLSGVRQSVHAGRSAGRIPCGQAHARPFTHAYGRTDADYGDFERVPYEGSDSGDGENGSTDQSEESKLTLPEFIYTTYNSLLEGGWRMNEIDSMDMLGFLKIRAFNAKKQQKKKTKKPDYIDTVWPGLKP